MDSERTTCSFFLEKLIICLPPYSLFPISKLNAFYSHDLNINSLDWLPYRSFLLKLVHRFWCYFKMCHLMLMIFFLLITCLVDCIDYVKRNYLLITPGSERVNESVQGFKNHTVILTNISGWSLTRNLFLLKLSFLIFALKWSEHSPLKTHIKDLPSVVESQTTERVPVGKNLRHSLPWKGVDFWAILKYWHPHMCSSKEKLNMILIL